MSHHVVVDTTCTNRRWPNPRRLNKNIVPLLIILMLSAAQFLFQKNGLTPYLAFGPVRFQEQAVSETLNSSVVVEELPPFTANNTALTIISMGRASAFESPTRTLVHRLVCSIRTRGEWEGPIVVLTDVNDTVTNWYRETLNKYWNPVYVLQAKEQHYYPKVDTSLRLVSSQSSVSDKGSISWGRNESSQEEAQMVATATNESGCIKFKQETMRCKRFKTYINEYLDTEPSLDSIRYNLYLDVDNVVGQALGKFFNTTYQNLQTLDISKDTSFISVLHDKYHLSHMFHTGILLTYRKNSKACLETWRYLIDTRGHGVISDQQLFLMVPNMSSRLSPHLTPCMFATNIPNFYYRVPFANQMASASKRYYMFFHVTNTQRAKAISQKVQQEYFLDLLNLRNNQSLLDEIFGTNEYSLAPGSF